MITQPYEFLNFVGFLTTSALAAMLASVLTWLGLTYRHRYHRLWAWGWAATASAHFLGAVTFGWLADVAPAHPVRLALSVLRQVGGYLAVVLLLAGTFELLGRDSFRGRRLRFWLAVGVALGVVAAVAATGDPDGGWLRFLYRVGLRSVLTAVAFLTAGFLIGRRGEGTRAKFFGAALAAYGLTQLHVAAYATLRFVGVDPGYEILAFTFLDVVALAAIAVSLVGMALETERRRTEMNAAAAREAVEALHRQDQRFRRMIEHSSDVITLLDRDGIVRYESPSITRLLGYGPEECIGKSAFDYLHPDDVPGAFAALQRGLATGQPTTHRVRFRHKNGSWVVLEAVGMLVHDDAEPVVVINSRDVTERDRLEARLREAHKMESVGRLAGGVAHDFNNVLTIIKGNADLALGLMPRGTAGRAELEEVVQASERAAQLTRQLLAFARRQIVAPRVVDANSVTEGIEKMVRRLVAANIEFAASPATEPLLVAVDPSQLEQVLLNLIVNAQDAMLSGGRLEVRVGRARLAGASTPVEPIPDGDYVAIAVQDTGVGIPAPLLGRLFEPFFTTKPTGGGTGLGLATSYGIIRQAGGYIGVESEVGAGACFTIYLPLAAAAPPAVAPAPAAGRVRGHERILVVEDDPQVRAIAVGSLRHFGYEVEEAADGQAALAMLAVRPVDLVVTDMVMPRLGGAGLAARLRESDCMVPLVFVSGYTDEPNLIATLPPRSVFLQKPYTPTELAERVRGLLDRA